MQQLRLQEAIEAVERILLEMGTDPAYGLPEPLFLFATTLMPVVNVDLLVADEQRRLLLTWRDDVHYGKGWHIPGGCVRLRESLAMRILQTARAEIGADVLFDNEPLTVRVSMVRYPRPWLKNERERSHNLSLLFRCRLPAGYRVENGGLTEHDAGYRKWFADIPADLLPQHRALYGDILLGWFEQSGAEING